MLEPNASDFFVTHVSVHFFPAQPVGNAFVTPKENVLEKQIMYLKPPV